MQGNSTKTQLAAAVSLVALLLSGCGSSGDSSTPAPSSKAAVTQISGTAATGAPFSGAAISIIDKTGAVVGQATSNSDGSYSVTLSAGAAAPFVIQAVRDDQTLISVVPDSATATVNITPITNLIASRLSTSGDPAKLAAELQANPGLLDPVKVNAKVDEIVALLKPLLDAVGATVNPLTGKFAADGTGTDRVLDSLSIRITPDSATTANIEVSIKQAGAEGEQPPVVQFTSATATPPTLPAVTASNLVPSGTAVLIADLMQRLTACFALPVGERTDTPDAAATAANVTAPACRSLFVDNDPATFKTNGKVIGYSGIGNGNHGSNINYAFTGIFRNGATGVLFDRGSYDFTRGNGDLVISYRNVDSLGGVQNQALVARLSTADNKLKITGNNYAYDGGVDAYMQLRTFINQPSSDYYSTGYNFSIPNNGLFEKVVVTSPKGEVLTLLPSIGANLLNLEKGGVSLGTSFYRVRSVYADSANSGNPANADTKLAFSATPMTDAELASYPQQSSWKFEYYLKSAPGVLAATQHYRTRARALTIAEFRTQGLANLTDEVIGELKADTAVSGVLNLPFVEGGPADLDWDVPAGALAPTTIKIFGRGPLINGVREMFDDSVAVNSSKRNAIIPCTKQTPADTHCTTSNGVTDFAAGGFLNGFMLNGRDPVGREISHFYATYKLVLP
ncbi:hypothetical protein D3870_21575 [Noviherbaspirillum cavernae]|uniref:Carboxypeptidase regulatory-like domain-containing protein n=1 Tax=Noviherbaspirillum cavernae TaxID=2320862 RepID=A0A418WW52_9BURK|nr:carboxypeptidase-like regulatory domain-containing protein [Noviherbaspirillum cavernae]RJF96954.1 hypothetical protein D3870_21575 [Noviherbaspirillum cavernae]